MEFSDNVTVLNDGDKTYYLIGTAHVSEGSVREVEEVISAVQPDTVCVELCEARYRSLVDKDRWKKLDIFKVIKEGKTLFLLANLAIGAYQRRLGAQLGVEPGAELLAAVRRAEEVGAEVALVDRDINITLRRTWGNLGFWKKLTLLGAIVESLFSRKQEIGAEDIEQLKEKAHLSEMLAEFAKALPDVKVPLIDERDAYLISGIEATGGEKIVAVVGAAHVPGMLQRFKKPVDRERISESPPRTMFWKLAKYIIPIAILALFVVGYQRHSHEGLVDMLTAWVLPNSIFCAIFTAVAGGKLLSVVTAFVASPITSLNPAIGAGVVVGLAEAWFRKPTVADAERINDDVQSWRGFYRNPFTRVLLVAVAATFGSALGAWIGLGWVLTLVAN